MGGDVVAAVSVAAVGLLSCWREGGRKGESERKIDGGNNIGQMLLC